MINSINHWSKPPRPPPLVPPDPEPPLPLPPDPPLPAGATVGQEPRQTKGVGEPAPTVPDTGTYPDAQLGGFTAVLVFVPFTKLLKSWLKVPQLTMLTAT
mgnify:CR=1 FL=1